MQPYPIPMKLNHDTGKRFLDVRVLLQPVSKHEAMVTYMWLGRDGVQEGVLLLVPRHEVRRSVSVWVCLSHHGLASLIGGPTTFSSTGSRSCTSTISAARIASSVLS